MFGGLINNTDVDITLKVECDGSICNYVKIRNYDIDYYYHPQSTCLDGNYYEDIFVVGECWEEFDGLIRGFDIDIDPDEDSIKVTCDASTVSLSVWSNKQCSSDARSTIPVLNATDKCRIVEFCSQCGQFMVYSTIFAFIASLFIQ